MFTLTPIQSRLIESSGLPLTTIETPTGTRGILRGLPVKAVELSPNSWNPNVAEGRTMAAIGESLGAFGQVGDIVVTYDDGGFTIIDGEHRFRHCEPDDTVYVTVLFGYSEAELKKLTIILNETKGEADKVQLVTLLASLEEELGDALKVGLPYSDKELADMVEMAQVDWEAFADAEVPRLDELSEGGSGSDGDQWVTLTVKVPAEAMDVVEQARDLVGDQRELHDNDAIAWGQVLESLAAEYLAMP